MRIWDIGSMDRKLTSVSKEDTANNSVDICPSGLTSRMRSNRFNSDAVV